MLLNKSIQQLIFEKRRSMLLSNIGSIYSVGKQSPIHVPEIDAAKVEAETEEPYKPTPEFVTSVVERTKGLRGFQALGVLLSLAKSDKR